MRIWMRVPRTIRWVVYISGSFLILMTLYRLFFFFHYRPANRPFSGTSFWLGLRYDLRITSIISLGILLITVFPPLRPFKREHYASWWLWLLSVVFFVWTIFYTADFYHFDYLRTRLNGSVLNYLADASISFSMMVESYPVVPGLLFIVFAVWLWFVFMRRIMKHLAFSKPASSGKIRIFIYCTYSLILAFFIFGRFSQFPLRWSDAYRFGDEFKASIALNPFQSFASTLKFRHSGYDIKKVRKAYPYIADYLGVKDTNSITLNFTRSIGYTDSLSPKPNVVLVICESYSMYKSSMVNNPLNPSPFFDSLTRKGIFFDRCFTPSIGTARGVWATITGIPDVERPKTASRNPMAVDQHSIINDFTNHKKFYFLGGSTTWANIRGLLANNLFGIRIYEQEDFNVAKEDVWGISDKNLFLEANKVLSQQKSPFFAIIQTADNHRPYTIPDEDLKSFKKNNYSDDTLKKYGFDNNDELNAFRYMDFSIETFMQAAAQSPYYKNTLFVFIGDHGIRGNAGKMLPEVYSKFGLVAEHVPLLFYFPNKLSPQRINEVCSQVDVLPTIAAITRQTHTNTTLGVNLLDSTRKTRYAMIFEPDVTARGLVSDHFYFLQDNSGKSLLSFMQSSGQVPQSATTDSLKSVMGRLTNGLFETAKYMLFNNKKPNTEDK